MSPAAAAAATPVRWDVGLEAGADAAAVIAALDRSAVLDTDPVPGLNAITIDVAADQADATLAVLTRTAGVRYAEPGGTVNTDSSDKISVGHQIMDIPAAWTWTTGRPSITVAVLDSGVTPNADLGADRILDGRDFVDDDADATDAGGHGTLVANAIAADNDNDVGAVGVCPQCRILPVRVMNQRLGTTADLAAGIVWAADRGAQILNVSVSTGSASRLLQDAVAHATDRGALIVGSAGNGWSARRYPGAFEQVLTVADRDPRNPQNTPADRWVDVWADGASEYLGPDGRMTALTGSSASTAAVSGIAALTYAQKPAATAAEVRDAIRNAAHRNPYDPEHFPPSVNAVHTLFQVGAEDTSRPVLESTGLSPDKLFPDNGAPFTPTVVDDHGIETLEVIIDGEVTAKFTSAHPREYTLDPPANHNGPLPVTIRVRDFGGNSAEASAVVTVDSIAPTGRVVSPAHDQVIKGDTVEVTVEAADADLDRVGWTIHPEDAYTRVPGTNLWKKVITPMYHGGFTSVILDKAGNRTHLQGRVRFDNEPPAGGTVRPAYRALVRGTFTSTLTGVTDLGGVAKAELWANGKYVGKDITAPYALTVRTGTANGNVTLTWRVTDRFGQWRTVPSRLVIADNRAPSVSITNAPKHRAKVKGTVKVSVKASDTSGIARVELIVNGKVVARDAKAGYLLSVNTKKQKKTMKIHIRAYDRAGNVASTTTRTWYRK